MSASRSLVVDGQATQSDAVGFHDRDGSGREVVLHSGECAEDGLDLLRGVADTA